MSPEHTPIELAYLAGFVDGEGFICVNSTCPRKGKGMHQYNIRIGAVNTNKDVLEWIKVTFGGYICKRKVTNIEKHKPTYAWYVGYRQAEELIKEILPYLKIKRLRAEIALKFRKTFEIKRNQYNVGEVLEERKDLRKQLQILNMRGPIDDNRILQEA